jgi:hypothetical protein
VRPCLPMILPRSPSATFNSKTVVFSPSIRTSTPSGCPREHAPRTRSGHQASPASGGAVPRFPPSRRWRTSLRRRQFRDIHEDFLMIDMNGRRIRQGS